MRAFIKSTAILSPQQSPDDLASLKRVSGDAIPAVTCVEPDYAQWIDVQRLRRMSRILKMGTTAALMALKDASCSSVDAIITGTAYGCLEDTGTFLTKMTEQGTQLLNPTPFMQSTHNTIGAQIATMIQCQRYNQTYVQGAFSFEHALLDALMHLSETPAQNILCGAVDEWTPASHTIHSRFGKYRRRPGNGSPDATGTIAGEGASWLLLSGGPDTKDIASVEGVSTVYKPDPITLKKKIVSFLHGHKLSADEVDLLLLGNTEGDPATNDVAVETLFPESSTTFFKQLCGEYSTASAFAVALAARILKSGQVPDIILDRNKKRMPEIVLICNSYFRNHHSLILMRSCRPTGN